MMTGAFKATYVFGYIVAAMFVLFFLVLVAAPSEFVGEAGAATAGVARVSGVQLCPRV